MKLIPDLLLEMSVFDWFKPLDRAIDVVDKAVEDKDLRNQLKAELQAAEIQLRGLAEQSYIAELGTKTTPLADSIHKLARPILSVLSMMIGGCILVYYVSQGNELDLETMLAVFSINTPAAAYNIVKGKGNPVAR